MCLSQISIGVSLETDGVDHSLVVHELVKLGLGEGMELIGFGIPYDLVCFDDLGLPWFQEGFLDFVQDILSHDVVIQLGLSFTVETEASHFAFDLSLLGFIPIILGTFRHEFHNVVVII